MLGFSNWKQEARHVNWSS